MEYMYNNKLYPLALSIHEHFPKESSELNLVLFIYFCKFAQLCLLHTHTRRIDKIIWVKVVSLIMSKKLYMTTETLS